MSAADLWALCDCVPIMQASPSVPSIQGPNRSTLSLKGTFLEYISKLRQAGLFITSRETALYLAELHFPHHRLEDEE